MADDLKAEDWGLAGNEWVELQGRRAGLRGTELEKTKEGKVH